MNVTHEEVQQAVHRRGEKKMEAIRNTRSYLMAQSINAGNRMSGPSSVNPVNQPRNVQRTSRYSTAVDTSVFTKGVKW